jgi:hypothetical protein
VRHFAGAAPEATPRNTAPAVSTVVRTLRTSVLTMEETSTGVRQKSNLGGASSPGVRHPPIEYPDNHSAPPKSPKPTATSHRPPAASRSQAPPTPHAQPVSDLTDPRPQSHTRPAGRSAISRIPGPSPTPARPPVSDLTDLRPSPTPARPPVGDLADREHQSHTRPE